MTIKDVLLKPFKTTFAPPKFNAPISTIAMPSLLTCMILVCTSFFLILAGSVYCYVNKMPIFHYNSGKLFWYLPDLQGQLFSEGLISSLVCTTGALALLSAFFVLGASEDYKKKNKIIFIYIQLFACSAPVWGIMYIMLYRVKMPQFFPTPFA